MSNFPSHNQALSIFPIGNGNDDIEKASIYDDEDSEDDIEFVLPKDEADVLETLVRSGLATPLPKETANDEPQSLLDRLDRKELTITERRCSYDVQGDGSVASNQTVPVGNGNDSGVPSPPSRGTDSCSDPEDMKALPDYCVPFQNPNSVASPMEVNGSDLVDRPNGIPTSFGSQKPLARKRRTRKTISPDDPAEALTEMSVRGLNLFRYATVIDGLYECVECSKDGGQKTFKNKYSFQRHAFLYHEGQQRKVFPCPVCSKEFSRPDKMKNHWRMTHGVAAAATAALYEEKNEPATITQSFVPNQNVDLVQLHRQLQQHHRQQHQQHQQHHQQPSTSDEEQQLQGVELDKRRQQEQDVLKIRKAVNAITLRQLQQIRFQQQQEQQQQEIEPQPELRLPQPSQPLAELGQQKISISTLEPSVASQQLFVFGTMNGQ